MSSSAKPKYEPTKEDIEDFERSYAEAYREHFKGHYLDCVRSGFYDAHRDGFREGFMKVLQERKERLILVLAQNQVSVEDISKISKATPEFIKAVLQSKKQKRAERNHPFLSALFVWSSR